MSFREIDKKNYVVEGYH